MADLRISEFWIFDMLNSLSRAASGWGADSGSARRGQDRSGPEQTGIRISWFKRPCQASYRSHLRLFRTPPREHVSCHQKDLRPLTPPIGEKRVHHVRGLTQSTAACLGRNSPSYRRKSVSLVLRESLIFWSNLLCDIRTSSPSSAKGDKDVCPGGTVGSHRGP